MRGWTLARALAIGIAVLAVADPALTLARPAPREIAVLAAGDSRSKALAADVASQLQRDWIVTASTTSGTAAVVVAGDRLPQDASRTAAPGFAIVPGLPALRIVSARMPQRAAVDARVPVDVEVATLGVAGRRVSIALLAGPLVVDEQVVEVTGGERVRASLTYIPKEEGLASMTINVRFDGERVDRDQAVVDLAVDVSRRRWRVLSMDARPSWQATFVRRALERDPRLLVASRVGTSRGAGTETGQPPAALTAPGAFDHADVVVVGAPEAVSVADADALVEFARSRAGTVVLIIDRADVEALDTPGMRRLTGVVRWRAGTANLAPGSASGEAAGEVVRPETLPPAATTLGRSASDFAMWRRPIGAGAVVVSGAVDSWRQRASAEAEFERFWQRLVSGAAASALGPMQVTIDRVLVTPGSVARVGVTLRDAALLASDAPVSSEVSAYLEGPGGRRWPVRLWPEPSRGTFTGVVYAPPTPGDYRLVVTGGAGASPIEAHRAIRVAPVVREPNPEGRALLEAWAHAHRGRVFESGASGELLAALDQAVPPVSQSQQVHPMRSAWWIVPFALGLGVEWWGRRRQGLR